jgi:hypothetical protein
MTINPFGRSEAQFGCPSESKDICTPLFLENTSFLAMKDASPFLSDGRNGSAFLALQSSGDEFGIGGANAKS